jgi:hypothetical protein
MPHLTTHRLGGRRSAFLLAAFLALTGCSFNHEWRQAANRSVPSPGMEGRWQGVWVSDVNGHTGALRCLISQKEQGRYRARFHATYAKVFTFGYTVLLQTETTNQLVRFQGEANLGWLAGGKYQYAGTADDTNFLATYSCKYDHGTFRLTRP